MLEKGKFAPRFEAQDGNGNRVRLEDFLGKTRVVLFFYPGDFTMNCTKEACLFRDNLAEFKALNAMPLGISPDSSESHRRFAGTHGLDYPLLSDPGKKIAEAYKVGKVFGVWSMQRITYVINVRGVIVGAVHGQFNHRIHVYRALECLKSADAE
jgi:thioredoxin-dependent peroxiredoxin